MDLMAMENRASVLQGMLLPSGGLNHGASSMVIPPAAAGPGSIAAAAKGENKKSGASSGRIEPTKWDVLMGRGRKNSKHPGNLRYQGLVSKSRERYNNAYHRENKSMIIRDILNQIKQRSCRFLRFDRDTKWWVEVSDDTAYEKVAQAFRNQRKGVPMMADEFACEREGDDKRAADQVGGCDDDDSKSVQSSDSTTTEVSSSAQPRQQNNKQQAADDGAFRKKRSGEELSRDASGVGDVPPATTTAATVIAQRARLERLLEAQRLRERAIRESVRANLSCLRADPVGAGGIGGVSIGVGSAGRSDAQHQQLLQYMQAAQALERARRPNVTPPLPPSDLRAGCCLHEHAASVVVQPSSLERAAALAAAAQLNWGASNTAQMPQRQRPDSSISSGDHHHLSFQARHPSGIAMTRPLAQQHLRRPQASTGGDEPNRELLSRASMLIVANGRAGRQQQEDQSATAASCSEHGAATGQEVVTPDSAPSTVPDVPLSARPKKKQRLCAAAVLGTERDRSGGVRGGGSPGGLPMPADDNPASLGEIQNARVCDAELLAAFVHSLRNDRHSSLGAVAQQRGQQRMKTHHPETGAVPAGADRFLCKKEQEQRALPSPPRVQQERAQRQPQQVTDQELVSKFLQSLNK